MTRKGNGNQDTPEAMEILVAVGSKIKEYRELSGLSQREMGAAAGLTQAYVYLLETGGQNVSLVVLARVAQVLGVSLEALLQGVGKGPVAEGPLFKGLSGEVEKLSALIQSRSKRENEVLDRLESLLKAYEAAKEVPHRSGGAEPGEVEKKKAKK